MSTFQKLDIVAHTKQQLAERPEGPWDSYCCITINQFVSEKGTTVMGRGNARAIKDAFPGIDRALAAALLKQRAEGQSNQIIVSKRLPLIAFPVKPASIVCSGDKLNIVPHMRWKAKPNQEMPGWAAIADLIIIEEAMISLYEWTIRTGKKAYLPCPGCGAGERHWVEVKPIIETFLRGSIQLVSWP